MKTQQEVIEIVKNNNPQRFKKFGDVSFRVATAPEEIVTIIDGVEETRKTAQVGDYILTGSKGEEYTISAEVFGKRYTNLVSRTRNGKTEGTARPTGECWGNVYKGDPFKFTASWNEDMICVDGDYLVSPDPDFSESYRIERDAFLLTYKPV